MSEGTWVFGAVCGIAFSVGAIPFAASYVRYKDFDLCEAYTTEVKQTMPSAIRKYMIGKPVDGFIINLLSAQPAVEEFASQTAGSIVRRVVRKEGESYCYLQMYLNVALPQKFEKIHVEPLLDALNDLRE